MDIKSAEKSFQNVTYNESTFEKLLEHLKTTQDDDSYYLSLLIGEYDDRKDEALQQIADSVNRDINEVDANEIITKTESETYNNLDVLFKKYDAKDSILYLKNGSRLCGVYTGNTQSRVKYATPQERYFLKKIQESGGVYVIDINGFTDADITIRRAAQSIVNFPPPQSALKRFFQRFRKQVTVHGHELKSDRPEHYGNTAGNF